MEKLALKCWIMKGKKSQEIEVINTLEQQKICLVLESFLKKNLFLLQERLVLSS
ncbi:ISY1 splicing factor-like protein [Rhinolophus ferrumequinum]|uniref:ISY1 splicing factor-like protein n=1 Tax=Rhinolophus ferrumequinum TaxID=59479 RepID=A0A7J7TR77_RHIFE|nr:ISY1 splicing factor-like protein [Rhinolophus ferrumequinum]